MRNPIRVDMLNPEERTKVERWYLRLIGAHALLALLAVALSTIPADFTWAPTATAATPAAACVPPGFEFHSDATSSASTSNSSASTSNYCVASARSPDAGGVVGP